MWQLIQLLMHLDRKLLSFRLIVTAMLLTVIVDYLDEHRVVDGRNRRDEKDTSVHEADVDHDGNHDVG